MFNRWILRCIAVTGLFVATAGYCQEPAASSVPTLEQENGQSITNPTWPEIESALKSIDPESNSFFVLDGENGYVQTAGSAERLTVEYRHTGPDGYAHYRLGRLPLSRRLVEIGFSSGEIRVRTSEVLTIKDCLAIFKAYFESGEIPDEYHPRRLGNDYL